MRHIIAAIWLMMASFSVFAAPPKWQVGFNENYVSGYLLSIGIGCEGGCPTNTVVTSLADARTAILSDAQNHIGAFREIIPAGQVKPTSTTNNFAEIADVINIYEDFNVHLVLGLGITVPYWMGVGNNWQPMPLSSAGWEVVKNNLAFAIGDLVKYLYDDPRISTEWVKTRLFIDPYNEFDDMQGWLGNTVGAEKARRAASLVNGVYWVFNHLGLPNDGVMMPSYAGTIDPNIYLSEFFSLAYTRPNFHIYQYGNTAAEQVTNLSNQLASYKLFTPAALRPLTFVTETGVAENIGVCASTPIGNKLDPDEYELFPRLLAQNFDAEMILFWRGKRLSEGQVPGCEPYFGVVGQARANLISYLQE